MVAPQPSHKLKHDAIAALQQGRAHEAAVLFERVCAEDPTDAESWCLLGAARGTEGAYDPAIAACREALRLKPDYAEAWLNLGASQLDLGRHADAAQSLREALRFKPDHAGAHYNLSNALKVLGLHGEAIATYRQAVALQPGFAEAWLNLGTAYYEQGAPEEAIAAYETALQLRPEFAQAHNNLGQALAALGRHEQALDHYRAAIAIKADYPEAHNNLGAVLMHQGQIGDALRHFDIALSSAPPLAAAWNNRGNALLRKGAVRDAIESYRHAVRADPAFTPPKHNLLYALNFDPGADPRDIFAEHLRWGDQVALGIPAATHANAPDTNRRLRIGYVVPDLSLRALRLTIEPILARHDSASFEIIGYANAPQRSSDALAALVPKLCTIYSLADPDAAALIRRDQVDILVDVAGHAEGSRLGLFAHKPAPVQASFLGYANTTGLAAMDYYIADAQLVPEGEPAQRYRERVLRLPLWICCQPPDDAPAVSPPPVEANGYVTLGSVNQLAKINNHVIATWTAILRALPHARMLIQAPAFEDSAVREEFTARFMAHGIEPGRIEFVGRLSALDHMRLHARVDLALDPFPWAGWATTCHTLWMGVPLVTLRGVSLAGRTGADLLAAVGLPELIAETRESYIGIATALASDRERLACLRRELRDRVRASALCDVAGYTRNLEAAYRDIWRQWCTARARES